MSIMIIVTRIRGRNMKHEASIICISVPEMCNFKLQVELECARSEFATSRSELATLFCQINIPGRNRLNWDNAYKIMSTKGACERQSSSSQLSLILTDSRTRASAVGVRGVMTHLKGTGCLLFSQSDFSVFFTLYWCDFPYDSKPLVNSGFSLMTFPWLSTGGLMS